MMSSPKTPAVDPTVGNLSARKISTNEQAQPLAYFAGRPPWLPLVWAQSNIYKIRAQAVTSKVGKSKQTTGYDYFGSLVGMLGCVRLDYLEQIEVAGKVVWGGAIHRDEDHPHHSGDIVIDGVGTFRVYWGTDDQPYDDLVLTGSGGSFEIADGGCGEEHPRYLDLPYLVVKDCYFGNNNSTPPTIRVMAERAAYFEGLDEQRSREGANPVTVLAELIGNPFFGLGLPDAVHVASAAALATDVRRDTPVPIEGDPEYIAAMGYISPLLDKQDSLEGIISRLLVHYDGWLRPIDGQIYFGRFPRDGVIPEGLPELSYHDFVSGQRPRFAPTGDAELITEAVIVHVDREDSMEKAATPVPNPSARRRLGYANPQTYQRPWVITSYQAFEQGNQLARHYSRDEEGCDVIVSRQRVVGLRAGDRFVLVDAPSETSQIVRITQRVDSATGEDVQLQLVLERGLAPIAYVPPPNPRPILPDPELVGVVNARAFQLPTLFADYGPAPAVVLLAERPGAHVAGYKAYFSNAGLTFDRMTEDGRWALRGTLASTVNSSATTFTINASGFDIARLSGQSDTQRDDDTLLLFIGFELCSIGAVTPIGGGQYTVAVLRGRRGSFAAGHTATAELWIMPRTELQVLQHADFPRAIESRFFRLASYTTTRGGEEQGIEDALEIELEFDDTEVEPPASLAAIGKAEAIFISWAYPEPPDDSTIIATDLWIRATNTTPDPATDAPDHTLRATGFNLGGLTAGTTRYIWAQNRDTIGGRSTLEGPVNATAQAAPTGPAGPTGPTGPAGSAGLDGPGVPFRGNYDNTKAYFYIAGLRRDAVYYSGQYWATANAAKNGLTTWDPPGTNADWISYGATYSAIATGLLLAEDATITKTLTIGTSGSDHGIIQSANYVTSGGTAGWQVKDDGTAVFRLGSGGVFEVGSGINKVSLSNSGAIFGDASGSNSNVHVTTDGTCDGVYVRAGTTTKGSFGWVPGAGRMLLDMGGATSRIQNVGEVWALTRVACYSSSDPRTVDAPLKTDGGAYIEKSLDVKGTIYGRSGSASTVAFAPRADDTDTGIYSDEAEKVKVACGGSQVARFSNTGTKYLILENGTKFRMGQTKQSVTTETISHYIEAEEDGGGTIKIAILT